ncbi:transmembrane protein 68-like protein [Dermatophagoides farinae]|uniref:Transmembrane protein 68-like protein n=1 Tax=Dermatophagoides farinae TaxID=6954 RepID=A0A9D4P3U9_DERFA|nr:transmembrane protein 68-like protein [Dermatophagoides farinae]
MLKIKITVVIGGRWYWWLWTTRHFIQKRFKNFLGIERYLTVDRTIVDLGVLALCEGHQSHVAFRHISGKHKSSWACFPRGCSDTERYNTAKTLSEIDIDKLIKHGTWPCDIYFLIAELYRRKKRLMFTIVERILYSFPVPGSVNDCVQMLNNGSMVALSPGGLREAMFSDHHHYETKFSGRLGFARIAKETQVPIIPIFTRNIREAFRQVPIMKNFVKFIYNRYRIPLFLTYGGMPVKLTTIIGEPIRFESDATIEQIAEMTEMKMKELIEQNQTIPGSIWSAIRQRFQLMENEKID